VPEVTLRLRLLMGPGGIGPTRMHETRLLDLPIEVLARVGPLIRGADIVVARTLHLEQGRTRYLVVGVEQGSVVVITVTRGAYGHVQREVERADGADARAMLHRLGLLGWNADPATTHPRTPVPG
jgi:hypothetical protein